MRLKSCHIICCSLIVLTSGACSTRHQSVMVKPIGAAKAVQPDGADALIAAGRRFLVAQNFGLAIGEFREALRFDPNSAAANNGLGIAYASIGRDDLARRHFERAIASGPDDASYRRNFDRLVAASATDPAGAMVSASSTHAEEQGEDGSNVRYHLRLDTGAPVERGHGAALVVALPPPAPAVASGEARMVINQNGAALMTTSAVQAPAASSSGLSQNGASVILERSKTAGPTSVAAPVLQRVSRYEVRMTVQRPVNTLAQIMKRDFLAQWEEAPPKARDPSLDRAAFHAAIGSARRRIKAVVALTEGPSACAAGRPHSRAVIGAARGHEPCSS